MINCFFHEDFDYAPIWVEQDSVPPRVGDKIELTVTDYGDTKTVTNYVVEEVKRTPVKNPTTVPLTQTGVKIKVKVV